MSRNANTVITFLSPLFLSCATFAETAATAPAKANPIPQLQKNLESLDEHVSSNAARSLGIVFTSRDTSKEQLQKVVDTLMEKLKTGKWTRLRLECIAALGAIRARKAVEALKETMRDENITISFAAGKAIVQVLHADAARTLLKNMGAEESESVQRVVYRTFIELATQDDVEFLMKGLDSKNWQVQMDALRGLERAARAGARMKDAIYAKVASLLGNEIANVAETAMNLLVNVRSADALNTLKKAAETKGDGGSADSSWRTRSYALKAINRIGLPSNESCLSAVIRQLDDSTANVIREAKAVLNSIRANRHYFRVPKEDLQRATASYLYPRFLAELEKAESLGLRAKIMREMGAAVPRQYADRVARAAAKSLEDSVKDKSAWDLRNQSLVLLGASGAAGNEAATTEALKALKKALENRGDGGEQNTTWRTRSRALEAFNTIGYPRNKQLLPLVIRQLDDPTANVLNETRSVLTRIRKNPKAQEDYLFGILLKELEAAETERLKAKIMIEMAETVPTRYASRTAKVASEALADSLEKPAAWELRTGAITLLGGSGTTADIEAIAQCVGDNIPNVRQAAGKALIKLSELCEETEKARVISTLLPFVVKSADWRKAAVAASAIGSYPTSEAVKALVRLAGHSVTNVQQSASEALIDFVNSGDKKLRDEVEAAILPAMQSKQETWEYGANVLGALKIEAAFPILVNVLRQGQWRAQVNAINAVVDIASKLEVKDKKVTDTIIRCTHSRVRQVHEAANQALRLLTPEE